MAKKMVAPKASTENIRNGGGNPDWQDHLTYPIIIDDGSCLMDFMGQELDDDSINPNKKSFKAHSNTWKEGSINVTTFDLDLQTFQTIIVQFHNGFQLDLNFEWVDWSIRWHWNENISAMSLKAKARKVVKVTTSTLTNYTPLPGGPHVTLKTDFTDVNNEIVKVSSKAALTSAISTSSTGNSRTIYAYPSVGAGAPFRIASLKIQDLETGGLLTTIPITNSKRKTRIVIQGTH